MATVNKKFSVKNGLAVDGNVAITSTTSFSVDGPSANSLSFALTNVTSATINSENIATQTWVGNQGYLTSETDPVFVASAAYGITSTDISHWSSAYGWGDHSAAGYLTSFTETDPVFSASDAAGITATDISHWDSAYGWGNHASAGYLTSETDPVFTASDAYGITATDISHWDSAYGWGNHASAGYLTSESDPVFTASAAAGILSTDINNWNSAYGWGNHASAGYITSAVETISNTDGNISFSASSGAVTADLAANVEISGDLTVQGDLTVNGDVTTINTATLAVEDNLIVLNTNVTGTPTLNAGIEVERGSYTNASLFWNETANAWYVATPGDSSDAATEAQLATVGNVTLTDAAVISTNSSISSGTEGIYEWDSAVYSTAKFVVQMTQSGNLHVLEVLVAIAGGNAYVTEYAEVITNTALVSDITVTVTDGIALLKATPVTGTVATKIIAQLIEA